MAAPEVAHEDGDQRDALSQFLSGPRSRTESSDLLGVNEDQEMYFEASPTQSSRREHGASPGDRVLAADYRSASAMSTESETSDRASRDLVS